MYPPIGILYLSAILKNENFHVDVIDQAAYGLNLEQILKWIKWKDPDVVGFSTLISPYSSVSARIISGEIKKWNPNLKVVFGNKHATYNDYRVLKKYTFIDVCVRNEGEYSFLELIKAFSKNSTLKNIRGITYRENDRIVRNEDRELIKNLDLIPFPDRNALKYEYRANFSGLDLVHEKFTSILASRGCPFNCAYCYSKKTYRARSLEKVVEEIEYLENEGYKVFNFLDDNFSLHKKRVMKLCSIMKKNRIDIDWICEGRVDEASIEMLRAMQRANCRFLLYGIESANQRTLNYYNKKITPAQSILAVDNARRAKIPYIVGSFILGAPGETIHEIRNTLKFALKLNLDFPLINVLAIAPGTAVWNDLVRKNILIEETYWETGVSMAYLNPEAISASQFKSLIIETLRKFFLNPKYILKQSYRLSTNSYKFRSVVQGLVHNLKNFKNLRGARSISILGPVPLQNFSGAENLK
jgi:radical SAM superfamily enzyme YgiQ (UPF0313 family)